MFSLISNLFSSHPIQEAIVIDGQRNHVVEGYAKLVLSPSFDKIAPDQLDLLKRVFSHHRLPFSHPVHKKVNDAIARTPLSSLRRADEVRSKQIQQGLLSPQRVSSPTVFVQNCMKRAEVMQAIAANGSQWQEVILDDVADDMLASIAKNCTQLNTLRIFQKSFGSQNFTDAGLQHIAIIPLLDTLELSVWNALSISSVGLQRLLCQPKIQAGIKNLTIVTFMIGDSHLAIISQFPNLVSLSLQTCYFTPQSLTTFLQASAMKNSLQALNISTEADWGLSYSPDVLTALAGLSRLNSLGLTGGWTIADQDLIALLSAKPGCASLTISGYPISQPILDQVTKMTSLQNLSLSDCSKVTDFSNFVQAQINLQTLLIGNSNFQDEHLAVVSTYSNLNSLSLINSCIYQGLKEFCSAPNMIKNLQYFYLSGSTEITSRSLGNLKNLSALNTLRIENVSYFNDETLNELSSPNSSLGTNLTTLELTGVSISDRTVQNFSKLSKLSTLMLANTYAVTKHGMQLFMSNKTLQKQFSRLYLAGQEIDHNLIEAFNEFSTLDCLYLGNMVNMPANPNAIWHLPNLKQRNTEIVVFWGELTSFGQFLKGE
jgi:hypothetical protein